MKRREFIKLIGSAAAWPLAAGAQQGERMRRIGVLTALAESDPGWRRNFAGFVAGLREQGWVEGQNFRYEFRYVPGGSVDDLRPAATELVGLQPDVILAVTSVAARLVGEQTRTIPIVFLLSIDPVAEGLVATMARPGGKITGFTFIDFEMSPARSAPPCQFGSGCDRECCHHDISSWGAAPWFPTSCAPSLSCRPCPLSHQEGTPQMGHLSNRKGHSVWRLKEP